MNSLTLRALIGELEPARDARFRRALAVSSFEFHLALEGSEMVISVHPEHNTLYLRDGEAPDGYATPLTRAIDNAFAGSRFAGGAQGGLDRVAALRFEGRDRLGDTVEHQLVVELTGKGGNVVLLQGDRPFEGRILARLRDDRSRRRPRQLTGGSLYERPLSGKADIGAGGPDDLLPALRAVMGTGPAEPRHLTEAWEGVGPMTAAEIWIRAEAHDPETLTKTWIRFERATRPRGNGDAPAAPPVVALGALGRAEAHVFRPGDAALESVHPGDVLEPAPTVRDALRAAHVHFLKHHKAGQNADLAHALRRALRKTEKALDAVDRESRTGSRVLELRRCGEAILARAHTLEKGAKSAEIPDPHTGEPLSVRLNPAKSPTENADLYFKKARKAERAGGRLGGRLDELRERKRILDALAERLDGFRAEPADRAWLADAKAAGVPLPREHAEKVKSGDRTDDLAGAARPRRYDLGNGWEVLVGRNDQGNHVLTFELARPGDLWMHAENCPGSHLVLRHHEKARVPPREVTLTAAGIAAFFSKARNSAKVPVTVAEKRHVRRPRKAPIGQAMVGEHKTVIVVPLNPEDKRT